MKTSGNHCGEMRQRQSKGSTIRRSLPEVVPAATPPRKALRGKWKLPEGGRHRTGRSPRRRDLSYRAKDLDPVLRGFPATHEPRIRTGPPTSAENEGAAIPVSSDCPGTRPLHPVAAIRTDRACVPGSSDNQNSICRAFLNRANSKLSRQRIPASSCGRDTGALLNTGFDILTLNFVPTTIAVIVVLVYRLFSFWMPTLAGIALVPYLEHGKHG